MSCRHWEVVSDLIFTYGGTYEPPEDYRPSAVVEADTKRQALIEAVRLAEFEDHVAEMRDANKPPFSKIAVLRVVCPHGFCWACSTETVFCAQCHADWILDTTTDQE